MPNLHDVIELNSDSAAPKSIVKSSLTSFNKALNLLGPTVSEATVKSLIADLEKGLGDHRKSVFLDKFELPSDMRIRHPSLRLSDGVITQQERSYSGDYLTHLASRRKTTVGKLKHTADMLNMIIMPYAALNPRSVTHASYEERIRIRSFLSDVENSGVEFDLYVVAPLGLYSLESHVNSSTPGWMYSSVHETTLTTLSLQLPMFRSLSSAVNSLDRRVTELESFSRTFSTQMTELTARLSEVENRVAEQTRIRAEQAALPSVTSRSHVEVENLWLALDPLLFAVKRGASADSSLAIVGPAWGPDFSESLLEISGLSVIPGQRASLSGPDRR